MSALYPPIEPYRHGMLDVGDRQRIYWEECGRPRGKAAVVLHGGPGSGCTPGMRRFFDPAAYRTVLFDQRGAGRSTPHASEPDADLSVNTTGHLLGDIEKLREFLEIERWLVYGGSWGATLALAYAESHPERVTEIVLLAVGTTRRSEIDWLYHGVGRLFPEEWERFRDGVPESEREGDLVAAYYRLMNDPDLAVREEAAKDWCAWEDALVSADPDAPALTRWADPKFRMGFAHVVTHYFHHGAWLEEGKLLREAGKLAGIPGVMVHGRLDLGGPLATAWELRKAWPGSELVVVNRAGHSSGDPGMAEAAIAALDRFATR
jgi:proline iminopeptidase